MNVINFLKEYLRAFLDLLSFNSVTDMLRIMEILYSIAAWLSLIIVFLIIYKQIC